MFKFYTISIYASADDLFLYVTDVDVEGNCKVIDDASLAKHFNSFYEASRFAALISYPVVVVSGVIINV